MNSWRASQHQPTRFPKLAAANACLHFPSLQNHKWTSLIITCRALTIFTFNSFAPPSILQLLGGLRRLAKTKTKTKQNVSGRQTKVNGRQCANCMHDPSYGSDDSISNPNSLDYDLDCPTCGCPILFPPLLSIAVARQLPRRRKSSIENQ